MNTTIKTRIQLLLAKIAGEDVDVEDITPKAPVSLEEELLLAIADRLDDIDGDSQGVPSAATTASAGVVKMATNVPEAADTAPSAAEFKALLDALIAAGIMAAPASQGNG